MSVLNLLQIVHNIHTIDIWRRVLILRWYINTLHLCTLIKWNNRVLELNVVNILVSHVLIVVLSHLLNLLLLDILSHYLLVLRTYFTVPILNWFILNLTPFDERILISKINVSAWKIWVIIWFTWWYRVTYVTINWLRVLFSPVFLILSILHVSSGNTIFVHLVILFNFNIIIYVLLTLIYTRYFNKFSIS